MRVKPPSLIFLICLLGFPQISETIYTPSLPDLARSLEIGMGQAEYTLSIYFIGFAFGVLIFGILADLLGRRLSMIIGIFIYLISSLGCGICNSIQTLLLIRFFQAFGAAVGSVVTQTILRDLYVGTERSRIFAIASGALAFSPALGPVIGGIVDQTWNWRANFFILAIIGFILLVCSLIRLPETGSTVSKFNRFGFVELLKRMISDPSLYFFAFLIGACNGIIFSFYSEAPFIFIDLLRLTPSQYGVLGLVIAASFFMASFLSLKLSSSMRASAVITTGAGISFFGSFMMWIVCKMNVFSAETHPSTWVFLITSILFVFLGIGIMIPNCLSHALTRYQSQSGTAGSIFGFAYYWLISSFTAIMGWIHNETSEAMPFYFCILTSIILIVSGYRHLQRPSQEILPVRV